jgi:hypothetical protein
VEKSRKNFAVNQNVVCREFDATFSEHLQNKFRRQILWQTDEYLVVFSAIFDEATDVVQTYLHSLFHYMAN